ncbi:MAG: ATP-dependent sacrificial sulfur transferase LarE [Proteobacteria bacterium]|nr:ATP-dependent sacrificial sulfur transferase LarE [Pseudomonadota bacterium]
MKPEYLKLKLWFKQFDFAVVAFSGGVDSTLVLKAAVDALPKGQALAVTADSPSISREELAATIKLAEQINASHRIIKTNELENANYQENKGDRCFFCKQTLYESLKPELIQKLIEQEYSNNFVIVDGTNLDDLKDIRPGMKAANQAGIRHPLVECEIGKSLVREICKELDLPVWNKPAMACLASRITVGNKVTAEKLMLVEKAESVLKGLGFQTYRVRYHELATNKPLTSNKPSILARIEVEKEKIELLTHPANKEKIISSFREIGFDYITIDINGYSNPQ